jgi:hypothetical protein
VISFLTLFPKVTSFFPTNKMNEFGPKFEKLSADSDEPLNSSSSDAVLDAGREYFDENFSISLSRLHKRLRVFQLLSTAIGCVILIAIASFAFSPVKFAHTTDLIDRKSLRRDYTCGASIEEAKAVGCVFDILAMAWIPPQCHDPKLVDEFRQERNWRYWADQDGTVELREDELHLRSGPDQLIWATLEWHLIHCNYEWQKMNRAMIVGYVKITLSFPLSLNRSPSRTLCASSQTSHLETSRSEQY